MDSQAMSLSYNVGLFDNVIPDYMTIGHNNRYGM